jgi:hypothetical protein
MVLLSSDSSCKPTLVFNNGLVKSSLEQILQSVKWGLELTMNSTLNPHIKWSQVTSSGISGDLLKG